MANNNAINSGKAVRVDAGGTGGITLVDHYLLLGNGSDPISGLGGATNGQIPIGRSGNNPALSVPSALGGMTVTPGAGSLTVAGTAGSMELIQSQTASSDAAIEFTTGITGTYDNYMFVISNMTTSAGGIFLSMEVSDDGGATWESSGYQGGINYSEYTSGARANINSTTQIPLSAALRGGASGMYNGVVYCYNVSNGQPFRTFFTTSFFLNSPIRLTYGVGCGSSPVATIDGIRFVVNTNDMTTGTFSMFGIKP